MKTAFSAPLIVRPDDSSVSLERVPLSGAESSASYKEDWLQKLLYRHPEMLPVQDLDDAFAGMIPVCREMGLPPAGDADIVYVTKSGRPVVVEAKLWRNPEARRRVLAQVLDYAKELSKLDFEGFDKAVRAARRTMDGEDPPKGLIEIVKGSVPDLDEATFCDSIVRNLKSWRHVAHDRGRRDSRRRRFDH